MNLTFFCLLPLTPPLALASLADEHRANGGRIGEMEVIQQGQHHNCTFI